MKNISANSCQHFVFLSVRCLVLYTLLLWSQIIRSQDFTWLRGDNFSGNTGTYGIMGVAHIANDPGARHGSATWTDSQGKLWLFGGEGYTQTNTLCWLNDLWVYDPVSNMWKWVRGSSAANTQGSYGTMGVASPMNDPGAREFSTTWIDASGNFWMFGGEGYGAASTVGKLSDLWKYNPNTNEWTWMSGPNVVDQNGVYGVQGTPSPSNHPGGRSGAAGWIDGAGNLWLFGGRGFPASGSAQFLNDLWRYNPLNNQWTWMKGANFISQQGSYGTLSVSASTNHPGAREFPSSWTSRTGEFYLFGGRGYPAGSQLSYLNDTWKYDPAVNMWTWLKGPNIGNQNGLYGTQGVTSSSVNPGGRIGAAAWQDPMGGFWLFGGYGYPAAGLHSLMNDLFRYDPATNDWTWMRGPSTPNQNGTYGVMQTPSPLNYPGAREHNNWWASGTSDVWLLGGFGMDDTSGLADNMNDLWHYAIPCNPDSILVAPVAMVCSGGSVSLNAVSVYSNMVKWYSSAGGTLSIGSGAIYPTGSLVALSAPTLYTYYAGAFECTLSPRAQITVTVNPPPALTTQVSSVACSGQPVTVSASGAASFTWSTGSTLSTLPLTPVYPGITLTLSGTDANQCVGHSTVFVTSLPLPSVLVTSSHSVLCANSTATLTASGAATYSWSSTQGNHTITIAPAFSSVYTVAATGTNGCTNIASYSQSVSSCQGISEFSSSGITISPNPSDGNFVVITSPEYVTAEMQILDIEGRVLLTHTFAEPAITLTTDLPGGVYMVQVVRNGMTKVPARRMVIIK